MGNERKHNDEFENVHLNTKKREKQLIILQSRIFFVQFNIK
jgi:hypothetical protein